MLETAELERLIGIFRENYRGVCFYCGQRMMTKKLSQKHPSYALSATIDHVQPLAKGGLNVRLNKVPCCFRCNGKKGDKTLEEFRIFLHESADAEFFFEKDIRKRMETSRLNRLPKRGNSLKIVVYIRREKVYT